MAEIDYKAGEKVNEFEKVFQKATCACTINSYFGIMDVEGVTDELVVRSSDGSLPDPSTRDNNSVHDIIRI